MKLRFSFKGWIPFAVPPSLLEFLGEGACVFLITNNRVERSCNKQLPNTAELLKPLTFCSLIAMTDQGQVGLLLPQRCRSRELWKEHFAAFSMTINHTAAAFDACQAEPCPQFSQYLPAQALLALWNALPSLLPVWVSPDKLSIYSSPANGMCNACLSGQTHRGLVAKNINR